MAKLSGSDWPAWKEVAFYDGSSIDEAAHVNVVGMAHQQNGVTVYNKTSGTWISDGTVIKYRGPQALYSQSYNLPLALLEFGSMFDVSVDIKFPSGRDISDYKFLQTAGIGYQYDMHREPCLIGVQMQTHSGLLNVHACPNNFNSYYGDFSFHTVVGTVSSWAEDRWGTLRVQKVGYAHNIWFDGVWVGQANMSPIVGEEYYGGSPTYGIGLSGKYGSETDYAQNCTFRNFRVYEPVMEFPS